MRKTAVAEKRREYSLALHSVDGLLQGEEDDVKRAILDYALKVVKRDLISEGRAHILYDFKAASDWQTDGAFWYKRQSDESPCRAGDFRFPLLYTIARMKAELEHPTAQH